MKSPFFASMLAVVRKDIRSELRSRELVSSMGLFALLSVLIFSFALELDRVARIEAVAGVLWVTIVFASILGLNRSLAMERDGGNLDGMLIAPIDRAAILFGKMVGNLVFALTVGAILVPLLTILFNRSLFDPWLLLTLLLGTLGFAVVGTLLATMTVQTRARESLLPIVMLPLALPVILPAVGASRAILDHAPQADWIAWPQILMVVDLIYLALCFFLFEFVIEE